MGSLDILTSQETPQSYLSWRSVAEDFGLDNFPIKREKLQESVGDYFGNLHIPTRDITGVQKIEAENFVVISVGEVLYYFDIYTSSFQGNTLSEAQEFRENHPSEEIKNILIGVPLLQGIMEENYNDGIFGGYLDNNDRVARENGTLYAGMTLREVYMTLRGNIEDFEQKGGLLLLDNYQRAQIIQQYKIYFDIVMGIGDQNEQGSDFFYKTEGELELYLGSIVSSFSSITECIEYARDMHLQMDSNTAQTQENEKLYPMICQILGDIIFQRLQREFSGTEDETQKQILLGEALNLIYLITSRDDTDISGALQNPGLAEDISLFILSRDGGVLDTLENCSRYRLDFTDPIVGERSPQEIISETESKLQSCGLNPRVFLREQMQVNLALLVGTAGSRYQDLNLEDKRQISLLARLLQKIENGDFSPETLKGMEEQEVTNYISELGNEITQEAFVAVQEAYDKNFESDFHGGHAIYLAPDFIQVAKDIGVSDIDMAVFETFYDIRGYGFFNPSDETQIFTSSLSRSALIIISTIAVVMLATAVTGGMILPAIAPSLIASGGGLTLTGSLASIGIGASAGTLANRMMDPKSYNRPSEMLSDLGSDFIINSFHAMYMERLTMQLWGTSGILGRTGLIGGDLGSGIGIEVLRDRAVQEIFHGKPLLGEKYTLSLEEAFWGLNYEAIQDTPIEIQQRFEEATHIYYLWNGYHPDFPQEPEFQEVDWSEGTSISHALQSWIERQEARL